MAKIATKNYDLWMKYRSARQEWIVDHVDEPTRFYFGAQWTESEREELKARGQADIVVNRVRAIIRHMVGQLTANKPSFRASPVTGGDRKVADLFNEIFAYIWRISNGYKRFERTVYNHIRGGLGWLLVYQDPSADWGQGEVKFTDVRPKDVYVDPSSEEPDFADAEAIIISKVISLEKAKQLYPKAAKKLSRASAQQESETSDVEQAQKVDLWEEAEEGVPDEIAKVRILETYRRKIRTNWAIFDTISGETDVLEKNPSGEMQEAIDSGRMIVAPIRLHYIERSITAGSDIFISKEDLPPPIENYPLIPFVYEDTGNPYPIGEVEFLKGPQRFLNKAMSVTILSAQVGSTPKVLLFEGMVDNEKEFQDAYAAPGAVLTLHDTGAGPPIIVQPIPLNNAFFSIAQEMKHDMEYQSGAFAMAQGDPSEAPQTYKATLALQEYGANKIKLTLRSIESSLTRLGQSVMQFVQAYYKQPKVLRLVTDPTEQEQKIAINQMQYDGQGQEIARINDVTVGRYDIAITAGSTMPTNRMAQLGLHMDLVEKMGVPVKYALEYMDVPKAEKIIADMDVQKQQQQQLEQTQEEMKQMQNELQKANTKVETADRAVRDAQYSANWSKALNQFRADLETERSRFRENLRGEIAETVRDTLAQFKESQTPEKGTA